MSEAHLHRYLAEFDFRYNTRARLGIDDKARRIGRLSITMWGGRPFPAFDSVPRHWHGYCHDRSFGFPAVQVRKSRGIP
jgi:hypothetical protein